jgi:hypothetical protein
MCRFCSTVHRVRRPGDVRRVVSHVPIKLPWGVWIEEAELRVRFTRSWNQSELLASFGMLVMGVCLVASVALIVMHKQQSDLYVLPIPVLVLAGCIYWLGLAKVHIQVGREGVSRYMTPAMFHCKAKPRPPRDVAWIGVHGYGHLEKEGTRFAINLKFTDGKYLQLLPRVENPDDAFVLAEHLSILLTAIREQLPEAKPASPAAAAPPKAQTRLLLAQAAEAVRKSELSCGHCGAPIPPGEIRRDSWSATCDYCGTVKDLRAMLHESEPKAVPERRPLPTLPDGMGCQDTGSRLELAARLPFGPTDPRFRLKLGVWGTMGISAIVGVWALLNEHYIVVGVIAVFLVVAGYISVLAFSHTEQYVVLSAERGTLTYSQVPDRRRAHEFTLSANTISRVEPIVLPGSDPRWGLAIAAQGRVQPLEFPFNDVRQALYFAERIRQVLGGDAAIAEP